MNQDGCATKFSELLGRRSFLFSRPERWRHPRSETRRRNNHHYLHSGL
jgi:hypothetical protein